MGTWGDVIGALRAARTGRPRERWTRDQLLNFQSLRIGELAAHATRQSCFYRELYGGELSPGEVELHRLPVVRKAEMMARLDDVFTDPRLRSAELHTAAAAPGDTLHLGEYRTMSTSGTTGIHGHYVYSRAEWRTILGGLFRWSEFADFRPRFPRVRVAAIGAPDGKHMTYRMASSIDVGLHRMLRKPATAPLAELVDALQRHQPEVLSAYPSVAAMLADEQLAGRLSIRPRVITTSSEMRTPEMTERIRAAWGIQPFDCLGLTELGIAAVDCAAHQGMHVYEDLCVLEVVDADFRPVPAGTLGARVLVTNLVNFTQPIIRFEITDMLALDEAPCPCGRTFARIRSIEGRSDDILRLPSRGRAIAVHPIHLRSPLAALPAVAQYQIEQDRNQLMVSVVPARGAAAGLDRVVANAIEAALRKLEVDGAVVRVELIEQITRGGGGKLKLVRVVAPYTG